MRLLYITNGITGAGGLERVLAVKSSYLSEHFGYEVHIVALNEDAALTPFFHFDEKVIRHKLSFLGNSPAGWLRLARDLRNLVKNIGPTLISVCDDGLKGFFIPDMLQTEIPLIYERHASVNITKGKGWVSSVQNRVMHMVMKNRALRFRKVILLTESNRQEWFQGNVEVIPNPLPFYCPTVASLTNKTVITVGSPSYNKGTDLLLDIWKKINAAFPEWKLEIYGDSKEKDYFVGIKEAISVKSVNFMGNYSPIQDKYLEASVFVLASRSEGFGMVLIEAMHCGLPAVSFDCPQGPADIIDDGSDGYLIAEAKTEEFAQKLGCLLANLEQRELMGKAARRSADQFLPHNIMEKWDQLFKNLSS